LRCLRSVGRYRLRLGCLFGWPGLGLGSPKRLGLRLGCLAALTQGLTLAFGWLVAGRGSRCCYPTRYFVVGVNLGAHNLLSS